MDIENDAVRQRGARADVPYLAFEIGVHTLRHDHDVNVGVGAEIASRDRADQDDFQNAFALRFARLLRKIQDGPTLFWRRA